MGLHRAIGLLLAAAGLGLLIGIGVAIYDRHAGDVLVTLGIPGALLVSTTGLVLLFVGGAIAVRGGGPQRPGAERGSGD